MEAACALYKCYGSVALHAGITTLSWTRALCNKLKHHHTGDTRLRLISHVLASSFHTHRLDLDKWVIYNASLYLVHTSAGSKATCGEG